MGGVRAWLIGTKLPNLAAEIGGRKQNDHFPYLKREKRKKRKMASSQLQHIRTPTSDVPTNKLNIWEETLGHTQQ